MSFLYDSIIFGFLVSDAVLILFVWIAAQRRKKTKKKSPRFFYAVLSALAFSWLVIFYGSFIEPNVIIQRTETVDLRTEAPSQTPVLRAALIGDLHLGPYKSEKFAQEVVEKVNKLSPDIILMAGDFISEKPQNLASLTPLKNLKAPLGVFAVLGNHDYAEGYVFNTPESKTQGLKVSQALEILGIKVLVNDGVKLRHGGKIFFLLGTDEIWTGRADVKKAVSGVKETSPLHPSILMSHNPDIIHDAASSDIDLVLAAHTHGGQIRLPFIGSVVEIPTRLGNKYDRGFFSFGKTLLFITSGLGESGPRARLLVPPEIVLLEIRL